VEKLSIKEKIGFGLGDAASNIVFQVVLLYMLFFYTDVFGISATAVGTLFLVVRIFDAVTDPIMGAIADRTRTKHGRYRPYLLWMCVPYGIMAVLTFTTPDLSETGKLIYASVTYTLLMTLYTAINIPYSALGGVMTSDRDERASLQSYRFMLAMVGGTIVAASVIPMVNYFGGDDNPAFGYQMAMVVLATFAIVCFLGCFAFTSERTEPKVNEAARSKKTVIQDVIDMLKNDQWQIIAAVSFLSMTAGAMKGAVMPFYIQYYLNSPDSITQFITAGTIAALLGAIFANFMTGKLCKVKLLKLAAFASMILHVVILFIPADQYIIALIVASAASFAHMVFTPILFSSVPDTVDYGIKRYGKGKMGMSVSGHLFSLKFGLAIGGAMAGWILGFTGYAANTEQIPTALQGIVFLMGGGMAAACAIILLLMTRYRLFSDSSRDVLTAKQP
jgi:glycoside/pentoside/hexuronide:cation symporter, GPH family